MNLADVIWIWNSHICMVHVSGWVSSIILMYTSLSEPNIVRRAQCRVHTKDTPQKKSSDHYEVSSAKGIFHSSMRTSCFPKMVVSFGMI
jgi:hypothetical protein